MVAEQLASLRGTFDADVRALSEAATAPRQAVRSQPWAVKPSRADLNLDVLKKTAVIVCVFEHV